MLALAIRPLSFHKCHHLKILVQIHITLILTWKLVKKNVLTWINLQVI